MYSNAPLFRLCRAWRSRAGAIRPGFAFLLFLSLSACARTLPASLSDDPAIAFAVLEQIPNEADQFFFAVSINETTAAEDEPTTLNSRFHFASGGRVRIESTGQVNGLGATPSMVSDGHEMAGGRNGFEGQFVDFSREPVPGGLRADLTGSMLRWGANRTLLQLVGGTPPVGMVEEEADFEPGDPPLAHSAIENASWGLPETFDGTPVRALTFSLQHPVAAEVTTTIWLDLETGLPVRQMVRLTFDESERVTEEIYSDWSFEAISSFTFSLPEQP